MEGERKKSMYRKDSEGWLKHTDFIILDMICLQLAYVLAYAISGYGFNPYETIIYRNMAVFLELADLVMIFAYGTMKSVLKRGYYRDFVVTLNHAIMVGALAVLYLFLLHEGQDFSRLTLMLTIIIYLVMTYVVRELWKKLLRKQMKDGGERKLLIVTSEDVAEQVVLSMQENNYARFSLAGVAVIDADWTGREIHGVPVVANEETAAMYVCQECSLGEAIAMSLIENMYIKKLILVSNTMGNKSVIHDGINGYVCDKAEQYAEHIKAAMKKFPKELPERAYQDVLEIYNTEAMKRKYIRLYTDIIEGKY